MKKNKKIIIIAVVAIVLWLLYKRSSAMPVSMSSITGGTSSNSTGASEKSLMQKYNDEVARWTAAAGGDADLGAYYFWQQGVNANSPLSATDKTLVRWIREIMNTPDWKASTQQKASANGVTFDAQIADEARYMMSTEGEPPYPN